MFSTYRMLSRLLLTAGEVRGRKKLQKIVFIAQNLGYPFDEPFALHVWGPYSEVLAVKLQEMVDWGFARVETLSGPAGNAHYLYAAGPNAARAAGLPDETGLSVLVRHLNQQEATFLEGVATALYLRRQGHADSSVREVLPRLKPDKFTDPERVSNVLRFADQLLPYQIA